MVKDARNAGLAEKVSKAHFSGEPRQLRFKLKKLRFNSLGDGSGAHSGAIPRFRRVSGQIL
ncbi:hypothetical protein HanIR_Chr13g0660151 [Helianthus annuus]|nr:hypothetical protein HanIR_Chr13g0660151 [Helianthus annuus]